MLHVIRKMVMWKAKSIFNEKNDDPAIKDLFVGSRGWCEKFMRRHGYSRRRKTTIAQKDPSYMVDRIIAYVMHVRRIQKQFGFHDTDIIAMDKHLPGTICSPIPLLGKQVQKKIPWNRLVIKPSIIWLARKQKAWIYGCWEYEASAKEACSLVGD